MFSATIPVIYNRAISLTISVDQPTSYNVYTAASSPTDSVDVTLTINTTIRVSEMRALSFVAGSRIFIINNGKIYGAGGSGASAAGIPSSVTRTPQGAVGNGTDALQSNCPLIITNLSGIIYAGGGGGGGGRAAGNLASSPTIGCGGGGGGGGQGYPGGGGGTGGVGFTANGNTGQSGSETITGGGVVGGSSSGTVGGAGSLAGSWGQAGTNNESGAPPTPFDATGGSPQAGGSPGRAIFTNGGGITWISGSGNILGTAS